MDRLAPRVPVTLRLDPFAGDVFVFRSSHSFSRQSRPEPGAVPARWHLPPPPGRRGGHYLARAGELVRQAATGSPAEGPTELCCMFCCMLCSRPVRRALGRVTAASPSAKIRRAPVMVVPRNRRPRPRRSTVRPCQGRSATTGCNGGEAVPTAGRTRGQRRRDWWRASRERDGRRTVAGGRRPRRGAAGKMPN